MKEDIEVFNFSNDNREKMLSEQRKKRIEEMKIQKEKQINLRNKIKKISIYAGLTSLITLGTVALVKKCNYENKPVVIVSEDMLSNVKLNVKGVGNVDPRMFDISETTEMYNYIKENNIKNDQIYSTIADLCEKTGVDYDFAINKLNDLYPEIFSEEIEESHKTL